MWTKRPIAIWTCLLHPMLFVSWLAGTSQQARVSTSNLASHRSSPTPPNRQQVDSIREQSALIIDVNHHYSNYNYPNSHHPPSWPHSHSNELTSYGWTSGHMNNLTASVGRNATFECVFPDLKKDFRLVWFHRTTVLALQDLVIVKNGRVSVRSHANTTFYLTIHDIREDDRGNYMCQVNTVPMRSQIGHLEVNVPPTFLEEFTSSDVDIREDLPVSLQCSASGRPQPEISWRREDGNAIDLERHNKSSADKPIFDLKGQYLNISKTSRAHSGAYLCIASNGIPSPISKRIFLGVIFAPVILNNKQSIGIYVGSTVVLECNLESYPRPSVYWRKDDQMPPIIHSDHKYEISLLETSISYRFVLRCVAKNMLNEAKTSVRVYEIEQKNIQTHKANMNTKAKNIFFDRTTTRNPVNSEAEQKQVTHKVTDNFSFNQESAKTEVFGYETNFISPEMSNEPAKENKATSHLVGWHILLSSSLILLQRVFVFAL